jgi:hypothetical protein
VLNCESLCGLSSKDHAVVLKSDALKRHRSGTNRLAGVEEHEQTGNWGCPGTWELLSFPRTIPGWSTGLTTPGSRGGTCRVRAKARVQSRGTAERRQRSDAGWAAGSHSVLIVLMISGNGTQSDPLEGSETPNHGTVFEKHAECIEIRLLCPRNRDG